MTLSALLGQSQRSSLGDDQGGWRQFVLDHLDYISKRSKTYDIAADLMNLYRYDLKRFLKDYPGIKRNEDIAWIVLLLNDLPNDFSFVNPGKYIIPSDDLIKTLYHSYVTIHSNSF